MFSFETSQLVKWWTRLESDPAGELRGSFTCLSIYWTKYIIDAVNILLYPSQKAAYSKQQQDGMFPLLEVERRLSGKGVGSNILQSRRGFTSGRFQCIYNSTKPEIERRGA